MVPNIPERYANLRILFDRLKLEKLDCVSVCDIKLCHILVGLSTSSRTIYPYYICEWNRNDPFVVADLRTFSKCQLNHDQFLVSGRILSKAKFFKNFIHKVLVDGREDDSEQSGESIHYDFNTTAWSRFKVSPNNQRRFDTFDHFHILFYNIIKKLAFTRHLINV